MDVQTQARDSPILNVAPPTTVIHTDNDSGHEVTPTTTPKLEISESQNSKIESHSPPPVLNSQSAIGAVSPMTATSDIEANRKVFERMFGALGGIPRPNLLPLLQNLPQHGFLAAHLAAAAAAAQGNVQPEDLSKGRCTSEEGSSGRGADNDGSEAADASATQHNWSYEEQFKQLYELNPDPKRKQWLDDWLSFMHRNGKPVTRIPIMAKQVLDLYELYHLVVGHGGLVEIIKKKLWREITKGLNLPSSITSAAFTLRTQYQKYLYDYECYKENLSTLDELTKAIDENKREGRRNPGTPTTTANQAFGGGLNFSANPLSLVKTHNGYDEDATGAGGTQKPSLAPPMFSAAAQLLHSAQQREALKRTAQSSRTSTPAPNSENSGGDISLAPPQAKRPFMGIDSQSINTNGHPTPLNPAMALVGLFGQMNNAHIKMTSRGSNADGQGEQSMVVSMEINGVMYQGVLFALPNRH